VYAFSGDQRFYFGDELRKHFRILIESASKIDIATAWVSDSNILKLLVSDGIKASIRMVVGVGGYATDPVVLKKLGTHPNIKLKIHGGPEPPLFHPKLYLFEQQHFRRALIGSMNFTSAGTTKNIESMFSTSNTSGSSGPEFERFWSSPQAIPFAQFDLRSYEEKRRTMLAAVKAAGAAEVLEEDVAASAENQVEIDALKEGWQEFLDELRNAANGLDDSLKVLRARQQFIGRAWPKEFTKDELDIMFGIAPYYAFGNLKQLKQNQSHFQGSQNSGVRKEIGAILGKVSKLQQFQGPIVKGLVQQLLEVYYLGPALATRLLVLARPDLFVVVNRKSFEGLQERFGIFVTNDDFKVESYVRLLEKIHSQPWFKSPEPEDAVERELWQARVALIDVLVYREKAGSENGE
jgi:hypothetical protein